MSTLGNYYITTAIAYLNGEPHLGHAYEVILADVMARHQKLAGKDVRFVTGSDEHGQKVAKTATDKGLEPRAFCDQLVDTFKEMDASLGIDYDRFIRTTDEDHTQASQEIWRRMHDNGDIYLGGYKGWYSVRDEAYFAEDELTQGENGEKLAPTGAPVEWMEQASYFFKLSEYQDKLLAYYEENPEFIQPASRRNEVISFVKSGLQDLSISRNNFSWGVPVPNDPDHVMYVWVDALTNYITAAGFPNTKSELYNKFWPADVHVIGKDIIRFHCIFWPAFLMSANLPLPKKVFAHGFINVDGQKMSKSVGNVVSHNNLLDIFGRDGTRYLLMREISHGQDGNFSESSAIQRVNADLANNLGNLAQRTLSMIAKNCDAKLPQPGSLTQDDTNLLNQCYEPMIKALTEQFDAFQFNRGLEHVWQVVSAANIYIDEQAPWKLKKEDPERMGTVLYVVAEAVRCISIAIKSVMPESADKLLDQLVVPKDKRSYQHCHADYKLASGTELPAPQGVFPRIELEPKAA